MSILVVHQRSRPVKAALAAWFVLRGWKAFKFQREVWTAIAQGQSGLLHATTGSGKTYSVWLGIFMHFMPQTQSIRAQAAMLFDEMLASLNAGELAQRRFREIARVSGLVSQGYPGDREPATSERIDFPLPT